MSLPARAPEWIREKALDLSDLHTIKRTMRRRGLHTVCEEARCPNRGECFSRGTATFLLMGDVCTRACGFCDIRNGRPLPLDPGEPDRVATAVKEMGLTYVVLTSVDRDDLPDGGSAHIARAVRAVRELDPAIGIEVLTPDFRGRAESVAEVVASRPDVFNHNVETVPRLYRQVRRGSSLERSLGLLAAVRRTAPEMTTKSGFMVGLGESFEEGVRLLRRLRRASVDIVTIGQYLRPTSNHLPVARWWLPAEFDELRRIGEDVLGLHHVESSPLTRSSYHAREAAQGAITASGVIA